MRIAVCLSGQLRNWKIGRDNQKWFWTTPNYEEVEVDYFVHTWDYSMDRVGVSQPYVEREITQEEFKEFTEFFDTKKSKMESLRTTDFYHNDHWSSLFYSFAQSVMMKREYELENNFEYDLVIKSRPDVCFNPRHFCSLPSVISNNVLYTTHGGEMSMEFNMYNFNDCVFYGNSYTMDLLPNLYFYRQYGIHEDLGHGINIHPLGPGTLMHNYYRDNGITPIFKTGWSETLIKDGCPEGLNLFEEEEFDHMEHYFREWYNN